MAELIEQLGIDWRLLIANSITFFIVLWFLRRFAFGPLMRVLDERQKTVAESVATAERIKTESAALESEKARVMKEAKAEALSIVQAAKQDGERARQESLAAAQREASELLDRTRRSLEQEKRALVDEAKAELAGLVVAATERVVGTKMADVTEAMAKKAIAEAEKTA